jgi:hypothetical protein
VACLQTALIMTNLCIVVVAVLVVVTVVAVASLSSLLSPFSSLSYVSCRWCDDAQGLKVLLDDARAEAKQKESALRSSIASADADLNGANARIKVLEAQLLSAVDDCRSAQVRVCTSHCHTHRRCDAPVAYSRFSACG